MGGLVSTENTSSAVSQSESIEKQGSQPVNNPEKPKKKICCACPDTKRLRDECIVEHGEESCAKLIEAHRQCLRAEGFNI